jgi:phage/conjugal plasmid C-4 type zinc finger TraR family protein
MSDFIDTTAEREQAITDAAIRNRPRFIGVSAPVCGCGEPIPEARQRLLPGITTCVYCASAKDWRR